MQGLTIRKLESQPGCGVLAKATKGIPSLLETLFKAIVGGQKYPCSSTLAFPTPASVCQQPNPTWDTGLAVVSPLVMQRRTGEGEERIWEWTGWVWHTHQTCIPVILVLLTFRLTYSNVPVIFPLRHIVLNIKSSNLDCCQTYAHTHTHEQS